MAEHRPFPPSPRRRALARQAGLHAASPWLVAAAAAVAVVVALAALAGSLGRQLAAAIAAACRGAATLTPDALPRTVVAFALPVVGAAALAALVAHVAQTRAPWLPRRRIRGAPGVDAGALPRTRRAAGELAAAAVAGAVTFGWLWHAAPALARLTALAPGAVDDEGTGASAAALSSPLLAAGAGMLLELATALAVAWIALGVLDALARHAAVAQALTMSSADKREDDRLAGADPRWQARRAQIQRGVSAADAIAGASVLVLGDDTAVAIAWDPARRPIPVRTATGRGPRARQLLGLARRRQLAVHRDPALAAVLVDGDGPVPEPHWPALARVIAAVAGRT